jgi:hypothetical protein
LLIKNEGHSRILVLRTSLGCNINPRYPEAALFLIWMESGGAYSLPEKVRSEERLYCIVS